MILDAFLGESTLSHLMSREAFSAIRRVLKPEGVLVINTFVEFGATRDYFCASLYQICMLHGNTEREVSIDDNRLVEQE